MNRFNPGQQVVCIIRKGKCWANKDKIKHEGPVFNETVTVKKYSKPGFIVLEEYEFSGAKKVDYSDRYFEPLVSDSVLAEQLADVPEPFTISRE